MKTLAPLLPVGIVLIVMAVAVRSQGAQGIISPPGLAVSYPLPPAQAHFISRTVTSTVRQPGLSAFQMPPYNDFTGYAKMVVTTALGSTTAEYMPGINPSDAFFPDFKITYEGVYNASNYLDWKITTATHGMRPAR